MRKYILSILLLLTSISICLSAPLDGERISSIIKSEIRKDPRLKKCIAAILITDSEGNAIAEWNSTYPMVPASTMKVVTTGLALKTLGADFRFETSVCYSGKIDADGTLEGDIYIIGGADPTLCSPKNGLGYKEKTFRTWAEAIKAAGIDSIAGNIIGDSRIFREETAVNSWEWGDLGTYYGIGANGLSFSENALYFRISPGDKVGSRPHIEQLWPNTPWMKIDNRATMSARNTGYPLSLFSSEISPYAEIRGDMVYGSNTRVKECSNKYPAMTCAYYFDKYLNESGIKTSGRPMDSYRFHPDTHVLLPTDSLKEICTTYSEDLGAIISKTNHESNNMYAETLFRMTSLVRNGGSDYGTAVKTAEEILKESGVDMTGYSQTDGSGLSRQNLMSPQFVCRFLLMMSRQTCFEEYLQSFPSPHKEGTLKYTFKDLPDNTAYRIKAKSGSMTGVKCYAGYITGKDDDDLVIFSVMINNNTGKAREVQPFIEKVLQSAL